MDIDYIHMKNFRQYLDAHIEFAHDPSKNFTIIQGANGAGKTNLVNDSKYKGLPVLNTTVLDESDDELLEVKVEIQFIQGSGNKLVVTRSSHFKKGKGGTVNEIASPHSLAAMQMIDRSMTTSKRIQAKT